MSKAPYNPRDGRDGRDSRPKNDGPRVNDQIRAEKIRLVGPEGEMLGVVSVREGLRVAEEAGLDLVEVSPNADPPVCKVLDYGKYRYELQKKAAQARKNQKVVELKELKLRPTTEEHDLQVKLRNARRFIEEGNKVKFTLMFRGREMDHQELGREVLRRVKEELGDSVRVEQEPRLEGRFMIMLVAPVK